MPLVVSITYTPQAPEDPFTERTYEIEIPEFVTDDEERRLYVLACKNAIETVMLSHPEYFRFGGSNVKKWDDSIPTELPPDQQE